MSKTLIIGILIIIVLIGYWYYQTISNSTTLTETENESSLPIYISYQDVPGWNSYENDEYGFDIKYPSQILNLDLTQYNENEFRVAFDGYLCKEGYFGYFVEVIDNTSQIPIRSWIQNYESCGPSEKPYGEDIIVDGTEGVKIDDLGTCPPGGGGIMNIVYLSKDSKIYEIGRWVEGASDPNKECSIEPEELFNQILSTFKFLD